MKYINIMNKMIIILWINDIILFIYLFRIVNIILRLNQYLKSASKIRSFQCNDTILFWKIIFLDYIDIIYLSFKELLKKIFLSFSILNK